MSENPQRGSRALPPSRKRALFAALLAIDAVVTLFPPLYWSAGAGRSAAATLVYFIGGSFVVLASILLMYAVERIQGECGEARS
ncbi:hypothetical protein AB0M68_37755 [Streptomyces sp. NPDC051453]|uniref:hypothetical protein n=1 Tax=Streptomyces sp. NPDC051453 TaxID=3154941 RepID=UPI00342434E9